MKKIFTIIAATALFSSCTSKLSQVLKSKDNDYKLKMAEQYYVEKKYNNAQQVFEQVFPFIKGTDKFEDVYYKFAYCSYYDKDYLNAENLFKTFVETFPSSPKAEECEYMRAFCYYKQSPKVDLDQTNTTKTIGLMQAFINTHPTSARIKDATDILDKCHEKLELKEFKSAELYFNLEHFKAAAISFANLSEDFPDSKKADEYKLLVIKSYFRYAEQSIIEKQSERFEKVISECNDFVERFKDSKLLAEAEHYKTLANNNLKNLQNNEQIKKAA
jgi:outer membrane protein assembly factor BamD